MIKSGVPVAIAGPANAGKSTLLNALLGEDRAIVTDIPGTTRDTLEETLNIGGILFRIIDTAGIRESDDTVEKLGIERTFQSVAKAEIVLAMMDAMDSTQNLLSSLECLYDHVDLSWQKVFLLLNKTDLLAESEYNKIVTSINNFVISHNYKQLTFVISAKTGEGIQSLKDALFQAEKDLVSNADSTFVTNVRHYEALQRASSALDDCRTALSHVIPSDLVAEDLRRALQEINTILGTDLLDPEIILHNIFSKHCIGK